MKDSVFLYRIAEEKHISVIPFSLPENGSLCIQDENGDCTIGIDEAILETEKKKKVHLAHELGHCIRGAFYNRWAPYDLRQRHENRADKWAIKKLVPKDELEAAIKAGYTEIWDLADLFSVTEEFIRKAICWYEHGNLDVECYYPEVS